MSVALAARDAGNVPVVFSSSAATYGQPPCATIPEDTPKAPLNPYGWTKLMVEQILQDFSDAYGLPSVCLRYFNACGADLDGEVGEAHRDESHLVPRAIMAAYGRLDGFRVFGDDYETKDGSAVRDYIHVTDLAQAHARACRYLWDGGKTDQFNVGTGQGTSVLQIIHAVEAETGRKVPYDMGPRRAGDPPALIADPQRANQILGFAPKYSDIDTVIRSAAAWHKAQWQIRD